MKQVRCLGGKPEGVCEPDVSDLNHSYTERKLPASTTCPFTQRMAIWTVALLAKIRNLHHGSKISFLMTQAGVIVMPHNGILLGGVFLT